MKIGMLWSPTWEEVSPRH